MADKKKVTPVEAGTAKITINWADHVFTLDSDNAIILEPLTVEQWNKDTRKMEKKVYNFLPIETIYKLLEQFYPDYSIEALPVEMETKYIIKKSYYDKVKKAQAESENEVWGCKTALKLTIGDRVITGNARGAASIWQITIDQMVNGFNQKMEARALKNACKKLGRVFRVAGGDEIDTDMIEKESIQNDATVSDVQKVVEKMPTVTKDDPEKDKLQTEMFTAKFVELFDRLLLEKKITKDNIKKEDLMAIGTEIRKIMEFEKGSDADKVLRTVYADYRAKFNI